MNVTRWWSWADVVKQAPKLGIPHFQRGQVWEKGNRISLLESMFEGSPCGTFVFWRPLEKDSTSTLGIPFLEAAGSIAEPLWLLDGQQRCRTLTGVIREMIQFEDQPNISPRISLVPRDDLDMLIELAPWARAIDGNDDPSNELDSEDGEEDGTAPDTPEGGCLTWFVCLPAIRTLLSKDATWQEWVSKRNATRYSIFRTFSDGSIFPRTGRKSPPMPLGMVPLAALLCERSIFSPELAVEARRRIDLLDDQSRCWLDKYLPWGPLFLTGRASSWKQSSSGIDVAPLRALFTNPPPRVLAGFRAMFTDKRFAAGELPRTSLQDAIRAYVRINRAGVRVQTEERTLATLTRWHVGILKQLAAFLKNRDSAVALETFNREVLLSHGADRLFGFALWLRVVARYTVLAGLAKTGREWIAPDSVERWSFVSQLEGRSKESQGNKPSGVVKGAAERASQALLLLDSIMAQELSFDHRMARPSTSGLWPMIEVLSHFSVDGLRLLTDSTAVRQAIARVLHWTTLHPYLDQAEMSGLCKAIHGDGGIDGVWQLDESVKDLKTYLGRLLHELHRLWATELDKQSEYKKRSTIVEDLQDWSLLTFIKMLKESRSLQNPAVGWLYALERRNGATEFSWEDQTPDIQKGCGVGTLPQDMKAYPLKSFIKDEDDRIWFPEKQHMIPFTVARKIANKGGTRATASPANDIGNLTWLSARQNGFQYGFSDRWAVLNKTRDESNLKARGFIDQEDETVLNLYHNLQDDALEASAEDLPRQGGNFSKFCEKRRQWMQKQMEIWLDEELSREALLLLGIEEPNVSIR